MPVLPSPGPSGGAQPPSGDLHLAHCFLAEKLKLLAPEALNLTTLDLAKFLHDNPVQSLHLYQFASFLREGQLREIVQFLTRYGPTSAPTVARLLTLMRGLPGNWELASEFLHTHKSSFPSFEPRTCALFAFVGGPKIRDICNIKTLIEKSFDDRNGDARLALAICNRVLWTGPKEAVRRVFDWESQIPYAGNPSFWREVEWAAYARACCTTPTPSSASEMHQTQASQPAPDFEHFPSSSDFSDEFLRIGGLLVHNRHAVESDLPTERQSSGSATVSHFVITPSLRTVLRDSVAVLSYGLPLLLEGPSGCGKTSLLTLLAEKMISGNKSKTSTVTAKPITFIQMDSAMSDADGDSLSSLIGNIVPLPEGGGFRWRAGPIGLAVQRGDWIVFENVGNTPKSSSAMHIIRQLAGLEPGDELEAPGRGEPLRVGRGFRCIATHTFHDKNADNCWQPPGGWDLWVPVSMKSLSNEECETILCGRFPLIKDCVPRVVNCLAETCKLLQSRRGPLFRLPSLREAVRVCSRLESLRTSEADLTAEVALSECLDVFVIWCSSEDVKDDLLSAISECWSLSAEVGRALANDRFPELSVASDTLSIGRAVLQRNTEVDGAHSSRLALNGSTLRLLERTLRCLEMNESVLLTGEAGSGKTAAVQELASLLRKKLVVVNLSRQSELGDLLGGFRPVEMSAAVTMLARKFEAAFCDLMSREKNDRFLSALQSACRSSTQHKRALRLMRGAMKVVPKRVKQSNPGSLHQWNDINKELLALEKTIFSSEPQLTDRTAHVNSQDQEPPKKKPKHSTAEEDTSARLVNFKFFEGALPQAMRKGHWLLLDEINLAPPELLERLITVVDNQEVTLSNEEGEVVTQSPGFVLFGSMNPPTDVGKRPLPSVLRTRFSEFSVGVTSEKSDVVTIVLQRLFHINASKARTMKSSCLESVVSSDVADFFIACTTMGNDGSLEDCTGKPVRFSLRHLSRALDYATGLCKYVLPGAEATRRALFEAVVMSFSTSLPLSSRTKVMKLAKKRILSNSRTERTVTEFLSPHVRQRKDVYVLEGIPIEKRSGTYPGATSPSPNFIISPTVKNTLTDVCRAMAFGVPHVPILLQGPTAAGKTSLIRHLAHLTGNHLVRINNHEHTDIAEYIGSYVASEDGSLVFTEGPLVRAARQGHWILLDELNLAPPDVLESLNRLLDDNREIFVAETGEAVKAAAGFRLFATQNPAGLYGGRKELSRAFRSRFLEVQVDDLPDDDLLIILESSSNIPQSFARKMIAVMRELQLRRKTSSLFTGREGWVTVRDLFRWCFRSPRSKDELAVHGFFLLGERARESHERELVRDVLVKTIGISASVLSDDSLYHFNFDTPKLTPSQECVEISLKKLDSNLTDFMAAIESAGLILTPHMTRLIVLVLHCIANNEPSLLVGVTGGGKTSCCSAICNAISKLLQSVNCHRNTEASDILGGYRPCRDRTVQGKLFEWCDGPLVSAMKNGGALLVDEINMADDAVIERLNSVLEYERSLFLSEKGHVASETDGSFMPEVVNAEEGFRLLATMNPGGDFGKRELSPALRNRFTEIWIPQPSTLQDFHPIIEQKLRNLPRTQQTFSVQEAVKGFCSDTLPSTSDSTQGRLEKSLSLPLSLRDVTNWCEFIVHASTAVQLEPMIAMVHGARLVFLDGLSVGSSNPDDVDLEKWAWVCLLNRIPASVRPVAECLTYSDVSGVHFELKESHDEVALYADCFPLRRNKSAEKLDIANQSPFSFKAPNTIRNTVRVARALSTRNIPILLEGPPGGGKSSLVAALANVSQFSFARVNLSDSTEMSDLLGTDAPGEQQGSFVFREGPLLRAVRNGWWILLDELNLASQSVLEGLNSILDHRRSLFIPELSEEVIAHPNFRLFGAQNPAVHGGGRRGLPRSFLNRFAKVWIESPGPGDLYAIARELHPRLPSNVVQKAITVLRDVKIKLSRSTSSSEAASSLRDLLRWLDLVQLALRDSNPEENPDYTYLVSRVCGELFQVILLQSLCSAKERKLASDCFSKVFGHRWNFADGSPSVQGGSQETLRVGLSTLKRVSSKFDTHQWEPFGCVLQRSRVREVQALSFAAEANLPVVISSTCASVSRFESRRMVEALALSSGKTLRAVHGGSLSDFEDFVGGYTQQDLPRAMRTGIGLAIDVFQAVSEAALCSSNEAHRDHLIWLYDQVEELKRGTDILSLDSSGLEFFARYLAIFEGMQTWLSKNGDGVPQLLSASRRCVAHLSEIEVLRSNLARSCTPSFKWKKSEFLKAIERGDWVFVEDADCCPPAVLDRLNPLLERSASSKRGEVHRPHRIVIAEAPSEPDGTPVYLTPHPEFRIFFSLASEGESRSYSLSKALMDRSLQVFLAETIALPDLHSISSTVGSRNLLDNFLDDEGDCNSTRGVRDHWMYAQRKRFFIASASVGVCTDPGSTNINDDKEEKAGTIINSLSTTPRSSFISLTSNSELCLLERDLSSLRVLAQTSDESIFERLRGSEQGALNFTPHTFAAALGMTSAVVKDLLYQAGLQSVVMGSSSVADFHNRIEVTSAVLHEIAGDGFHRVQQLLAVLRESVSSKDCVSLFGSRDHEPQVTPIDPIYAMDTSCVLFLESSHVSNVKTLQNRAKLFRLNVISLFQFKHSFEQALLHGSNARDSRFGDAQNQVVLQSENHNVAMGGSSIDQYAFEVLNGLYSRIPSISNDLVNGSGWRASEESIWVTFVEMAESMCAELCNPSGDVLSSLVAILQLFRSSQMVTTRDPELAQWLRALTEKGNGLLEPIMSIVERGVPNVTPKTEQGLSLEKQLWPILSAPSADKLTLLQVDAGYKALASLRSSAFETRVGALDSVSQVIAKIQVPKNSLAVSTMGHWEVLRDIHSAKSVLRTAANLGRLTMEGSSRRHVQNAVTLLKLSPWISPESVVSLQSLLWFRDGCRDGSAGNVEETVRVVSKSVLTASYRELSRVLEVCCHENEGFGGALHVFNQARNPSCSFWDLPSSTKESLSAVNLVGLGVQSLSNLMVLCRDMFLNSLVSALEMSGALQDFDLCKTHSSVGSDRELFSSLMTTVNSSLGEQAISAQVREAISSSTICADRALRSNLYSFLHVNNPSQGPVSVYHTGFLLGLMCFSVGVLRITTVWEHIEGFHGVDPSTVAEGLTKYKLHNAVKSAAASLSYEIVGANRLGCDNVSQAVPVVDFMSQSKACLSVCASSHRKMVFRPHGSPSFKSFHNSLRAIVSLVTRVVQDCKLQGYADGSKPFTDQAMGEFSLVKNTLSSMIEKLEYPGLYAHLRDLTTDAILALRELHSGISLCEATFTSSENLRKYPTCPEDYDWYMYPRVAFSDGRSCSKAMASCFTQFREHAKALHPVCGYLIVQQLNCSSPDFAGLSDCFRIVSEEWKRSIIHDEDESERKNSLHVIREAAKSAELKGYASIEALEGNEEEDFIRTFNPLSAETEETLLGVERIDQSDGSQTTLGENTSKDCDVRIDASVFCDLHNICFSPKGVNRPQVSALYREHVLRFIPPHLHGLLSSQAPFVDSMPSPWPFLTCCYILQQFEEKSVQQPDAEKEATMYNFYVDRNPSETLRASRSLAALRDAIQRVQMREFADIDGHPVLSEVSVAIERVAKSCKSGEPLSQTVVGIENVLRKADQWHRLFAKKTARLDHEVGNLSSLVLNWRRLEMSSWKHLLHSRKDKFRERATQWFFLMYDAVVNHTRNEEQHCEEMAKEILASVDRFLRSSPLGEFRNRLEIVASVAHHVAQVASGNPYSNKLGCSLRLLSKYYESQLPGITDQQEAKEKIVFKKLRDFEKLVSWTPEKDLGSSQTMSKEQSKDLDYYRLKAAAEKTRRRIHKLCVELDVLYRSPVYGFMSNGQGKLGLDSLKGDEHVSGSKALTTPTFSTQRMKGAISLIQASMGASLQESVSPGDEPCADSVGNSRSTSVVLRTMSELSVSLSSVSKTDVEKSTRLIPDLRTKIRERVADFQTSEKGAIQVKKRCVVSLLKELVRLGLSPYEAVPSERRNPTFWYSAPDPTDENEFNEVANILYVTVLSRLGRLNELSDSRLRNADFAADEARRARNLCASLFDNICLERSALNSLFSRLSFLKMQADNLSSISPSYAEVAGPRWTYEKMLLCKTTITKLEMIVRDYEVVCEAQTGADKVHASDILKKHGERHGLRELLLDHVNKDSQEGSSKSFASLQQATKAMQDVICSENGAAVRGIRTCPSSLLHRKTGRVLDEASHSMSGLLPTLKSLTRGQEQTPDSVAMILLRPTIAMLQDFHQAVSGVADPGDANIGESLAQSHPVVQDVTENILLATQDILKWSGVREVSGNVNGESKEVEENSKLLREAHTMLMKLAHNERLGVVQDLLATNHENLSRLAISRAHVGDDALNTFLRNQRTAGVVLRSFLEKIITPCLTGLLEFHYRSMNLLRTITSLFIGLCEQGYCRPPETEEGDVEETSELKDGTGFGEAGDGDMSGAQDVSEQVEDEEQLLGLQDDQPSQKPETDQEQQQTEDGFEMTNDFDGELEDAPKNENEDDVSGDEEAEKEMSNEKGIGDDIVDEKLWSGESSEMAGQDDSNPEPSANDQNDLVAREEQKEKQGKDPDEAPDVGHDMGTEDQQEQVDQTEPGEEKEESSKQTKQKNQALPDDKDGNPNDAEEPQVEEKDENNPVDERMADETAVNDEPSNLNEENRDVGQEQSSSEKENKLDETGDDSSKERDAPPGNDETASDELRNDEEEGGQGDETNDDPMTGTSTIPDQVGSPEVNPTGADDMPEDISDLNLDNATPLDHEDDEDPKQEGENEDDELPDDMDVDDVSKHQQQKETLDEDENGEDVESQDVARTAEETNMAPQNMDIDGHGDSFVHSEQRSKLGVSSEKSSSADQDEGASEGTGLDSAGPQSSGETPQFASGVEQQSSMTGDDKMREQLTDPNPLRQVADSSLSEQWKKITEMLQQEAEDQELDTHQNEEDSNRWEISKQGEESNKEHVGLAAATEEQHNPLPAGMEDVEEDSPEVGREEERVQSSGKADKNQSVSKAQDENQDMAELERDENIKPNESADREVREHPAKTSLDPQDEASVHVEDMELVKPILEEHGSRNDDEMMEKAGSGEDVNDGKWLIEKLDVETACKLWSNLDAKVSPAASSLCEQLRLVLEPTLSSGLAGGYRTGKRLNMRKVIEYVASEFRKDRIWLRRVKPDKRTYDVLLAIDDSESMTDSGAGPMAIESLALVVSALSKLEVGRVAVVSFGSETNMVRDFDDSLPISVDAGGAMLRKFSFSQRETNIVRLMEFISSKLATSVNNEHVTLAFVVSDGRLSNREAIRKYLRKLKAANVLVAFLILDKGSEETSIFDVKQVEYGPAGKVSVMPYMQDFPIDFYAVIRDVSLLPSVFSDALRQWIETTNSQLS